VSELSRLVAQVVGYEGPVEWDATKPDGTPQKLLDTTRVRSLGWAPTTSLEDGIKNAYEWFLRHGAGTRHVPGHTGSRAVARPSEGDKRT
jgi:GDP-L-fucose synthase